MPSLDQLFNCISKGDLNRLITLINRNLSMVNAANEEGISLLQYSVLQDQLNILIYLANLSECQLGQYDMHYQHTALHTACLLDSVKAVQTIVQKLKPIELNAQDKFGWTALHHACRNGNVSVCKLLVQHKAKMDIQNKLGKTPIHYAAQYGYQEIVKLLYDHVGPLVTPCPTEKLSLPILTLMHCAAFNGHSNVVQWLQSVCYPPNIKCRRALHQNGEITSDELPEDTAGKRGYLSLKANIQAYSTQYKIWLQDILGACSPLEYAKLCLCGPVDSGKTSLKERLEKSQLQLMRLGLGLDSNESSETGKKHTYGIEVSNLQLTSKDSFSLWDFCGEANSYITHCHFMTTERTGYVIILDLTKPIDQLKHELDEWLMFIKGQNLGSKLVYQSNKRHPDIVAFSTSTVAELRRNERGRASTVSNPTKVRDRLYSNGLRPLLTSQAMNIRSQSAIEQSTIMGGSSSNKKSSPSKLLPPIQQFDVEILPSITQVPVIIVGSHFDRLAGKQKKAVVQQMDEAVNESSKKYHRSLNVIQQVFPISGGDKSSTSEIRYFKEQLSTVRTVIMENSPGFPRVFDNVAKKIESMKLDSPDTKVIEFLSFCETIRSEVNRLLSDTQIAYILRHLNNTGIVVYIQSLNQWVFLDPMWLCNMLGYLFSPSSHPNHILCKNGEITRKILQAYLPSCSDAKNVNITLKILRNLELGYSSLKTDHSELYRFTCPRETNESSIWVPEDRFTLYNGRVMLPCSEMDFLPIGFVPHLHMLMVSLQNGKNISTFQDGFLLDYTNHQCLVKVEPGGRSVSFIGRITTVSNAPQCISTMDYAQLSVTKLCRLMCPAFFFKWSILNPSSLQSHGSLPPCYPASVVAMANRRRKSVVNPVDAPPPILDSAKMMFFGDQELMLKGTGLGMKVAYLDDHVLEQVGHLLAEDEIQLSGWKGLAKFINQAEYIELLEGETHPVKKLILKWGEKPKWTVDSLLYALKEINRVDAYDYVRAKTNPKYDTEIENI